MTTLLFCSFPFTVIVLVKQKAGYEKSDKKAAFCLGLSRSLVWDSKIHLIFNEEQPCMSAEVAGMVTNSSVSGATLLVQLCCPYQAPIAPSYPK